jgi:hypothetical protein
MRYAIEMTLDSMAYIPSSIKISAGVQAILRQFVRNFSDCNPGISEGGSRES